MTNPNTPQDNNLNPNPAPAPAAAVQAPDAPASQPNPRPKRSTRLALERDARIIIQDLQRPFAPEAIFKRHHWKRDAFYRRLRLAKQMLTEKDDPARSLPLHLKRREQYETLRRHAETRAAQLQTRLAQANADRHPLEARDEAALTASLLKTLDYIAQYEEKITALSLQIESVTAEDIPELDDDDMEELVDYLETEEEQMKKDRAKKSARGNRAKCAKTPASSGSTPSQS